MQTVNFHVGYTSLMARLIFAFSYIGVAGGADGGVILRRRWRDGYLSRC